MIAAAGAARRRRHRIRLMAASDPATYTLAGQDIPLGISFHESGATKRRHARLATTTRATAQENRMSNQSDTSIFYLLGGISFFALAVILFMISPRHDSATLLPIGGVTIAGVLSLIAYFGTRGRGGPG